jgi:hypothetical protein
MLPSSFSCIRYRLFEQAGGSILAIDQGLSVNGQNGIDQIASAAMKKNAATKIQKKTYGRFFTRRRNAGDP